MVGATGFEPATTCTPSPEPGLLTVMDDSRPFVITQIEGVASVQRWQQIAPVFRNFAANLLPPSRRAAEELNGGIKQLLTVRLVAEHLGVCTATVYRWAATGKLPHVRIVNVIRVRSQDLTRLLSLRPPPAALPPQSP